MTPRVCLTVDVEDWYEGMRHLGTDLVAPKDAPSGLARLSSLLAEAPDSRVTLFVVGNYLDGVRDELQHFRDRGHEIASHGPDHGFLPSDRRGLLEWLKRGRRSLEDQLQVAVRGMRSPRFSFPPGIGLAAYRDLLAEAGFDYVSDRSCLGPSSPIAELPVMTAGRLPLGGGSYQRVLPRRFVARQTSRATSPVVLYYHSYDFGVRLPSVRSTRSLAVARQVLCRRRVEPVFRHLLDTYGSEGCDHARVTL
jgi:peptidoglycan/xylan/chitin deacetylase (PgdA/CDA1 family)